MSALGLRRLMAIALLAGAMALGLSERVFAAGLPADEAAEVSADIDKLLTSEPGLPLPVRQRRDVLQAYYRAHPGQVIWLGTQKMNDFVQRISAADEDGLDPEDYPAGKLASLAAVADQADPLSQGVIELFFSAAFLEFASDLQVGRLLPRKVDPEFFLQTRTIVPAQALDAVVKAPDMDAFFADWEPQQLEYAALREVLARYRAIEAIGGWPTVPAVGPSMKPGVSDPRVPALRARLVVTDGAQPTAPPGGELVYDEGLVAAVKRFQDRHGLDDDGTVGKATIVALNVPVAVRIDQIITGMERWRWMPADFGADYLIVNIAGFELKRVKSGKVVEQMAVVVGKPGSHTPQFSNMLRTVEFNPYWNVPPTIAVKEELPVLQKNAASLDAQGFEAVQGNQVIPVAAVDWSRYGPGNFPFQLRQRPGPKNALGQMKFLFPNQFDVYLHDTPAKTLFDKTDRAFSHGCIRLSRPLDLAIEVLADTPGWDRQRIQQAIDTGDRVVVNLAKPLPIHITYMTSWVENGVVNFRADVYQHDAKLINALAGRSLAW